MDTRDAIRRGRDQVSLFRTEIESHHREQVFVGERVGLEVEVVELRRVEESLDKLEIARNHRMQDVELENDRSKCLKGCRL